MNLKQYILTTVALLHLHIISAENKLFNNGLNTQIKDNTIEELMELLKNPANEHLDILIIENNLGCWIKWGSLKDFSEIREILTNKPQNKNNYPNHMYDKYKYLLFSAEQNKVMYCKNINAIIFNIFDTPDCADCEKLILEHDYQKQWNDIDWDIDRLSYQQREINLYITEKEENMEKYRQKIRQQIGELLLQKRELESKKQNLQTQKHAFENSTIMVKEY